jgi:branched-chain amino acid transport system permease protein
MTILGGMHTFIGPVIGVAVFLYLQNKLSWVMERWELVVGIMFMALILIFPDGIVGTIKARYAARKGKPARGSGPEPAPGPGAEG